MGATNRTQVWPKLGRFCGLMCVGSLTGVLTWIAASQSNGFYYKFNSSVNRLQYLNDLSSYNMWVSIYYSLYGLEFLCTIANKLMLLERLMDNATRVLRERKPELSAIQRVWSNGSALSRVFNVVAVTVVLCSVAGMIAYFVAAAYAQKIVEVANQAANLCDTQGNDTNSSLALLPELQSKISEKHTAHASQSVSEALALLLTTFAYAVLVALSIAIFRRVEQIASSALVVIDTAAPQSVDLRKYVNKVVNSAAEQRWRLTIACVMVLIAFPVRAVFNLLQAYSSFNAGYSASCSPCGDCQTDQYVVRAWINYTPEFQSVAVAISSPLPLVLSLWLITAAHVRDQPVLPSGGNVFRASDTH